ncbi:hypothetical protein [Granulicella mallensis]|uniref:hypothetical protein n=1 Tax=Granulicella mallensis TaxID=940614 RepID=UPI000694A75D|nr:hypothetical protein [Granulicella mallensis]
MLAPHDPPCLELSALRMEEVAPLVEALPTLDLARYAYLSFHAPGRFTEEEEEEGLADLLFQQIPTAWPIIMHPDAIFDFGHWRGALGNIWPSKTWTDGSPAAET